MLRGAGMTGLAVLLLLAGVMAMPAAVQAQDAVPAEDVVPAHDSALKQGAPMAPEGWAVARLEGLKVREALAREVAGMRRLLAVQKELGAWNRERAEVGSAVRTLRPEICGEEELERWCRLAGIERDRLLLLHPDGRPRHVVPERGLTGVIRIVGPAPACRAQMDRADPETAAHGFH